MQEAYLWLAEIKFNKGDYKGALGYCDMAIEALTDKNRISRPDIAYCLKAQYFIKIDEYEEAIQVLNQLRHLINYDDPYALLLLANIAYNKSCLLRDNSFEQSMHHLSLNLERKIKDVAVHCNYLLKRQSEERNLYVGLALAAIFAEKARFDDAIKALKCA